MSWTPETITQLRELWSAGVSTLQIGKRLGMTKNAVVGKAHRLELDGRPAPISKLEVPIPDEAQVQIRALRKRGLGVRHIAAKVGIGRIRILKFLGPGDRPLMPKQPKKRAPVIKSQRQIPLAVVAPEPKSVVVPLAKRVRSATSEARCCFPLGDPQTAGFRFCDDPVARDTGLRAPWVYCLEHRRVAYARSSAMVEAA